MKLKIKKLNSKAEIPKRAHENDAGLDLVATSREYTDSYVEYGTGLSLEIESGFVGLIFPRSSISNKDQTLCNCVGVIDSSYRGEVTFRFKDTVNDYAKHLQREYEIGDRVGQLVIIELPKVDIIEVEELNSSSRGSGGYGSSGK